MKKFDKRCVLCILDGFGLDILSDRNGVRHATHFYDMMSRYLSTSLHASSNHVGLPKDQVGNSEVGHTTLGLGRVVLQDLPHFSDLIETGTIWKIPAVQNFLNSSQNIHLVGLLSEGGVHSHEHHIFRVIEGIHQRFPSHKIYLHAFSDGRDSPPCSILPSLERVIALQEQISIFRLATLMGRFYGMDRDQRQERTQRASDTILHGKAPMIKDPVIHVLDSYERGITDEFLEPVVIAPFQGILKEKFSGIWHMNFRRDRVRQLFQSLIQETQIQKVQEDNVSFLATSFYGNEFKEIPFILQKETNDSCLGQVLSFHGKRQLRLAETEKYAHVTFFFNGGQEAPFEGEVRILVPSPKVETYDRCPKMSSKQITSHLKEAMLGPYDFIVVNYANPDMVGHTGVVEAIREAIQSVDEALKEIEKIALQEGIHVMITADHGNAEYMFNDDLSPHTAHTCSQVPFLVISPNQRPLREGGSLQDVAPTILDFFNIEHPPLMKGKSLWSI